MPDNVAPMVDFNHTIVELVGNEVMVGCRGGDGTSQRNRDQSGGEYDLDGKFHGASLLWRRGVGCWVEKNHSPTAKTWIAKFKLRPAELSTNCHFFVTQ